MPMDKPSLPKITRRPQHTPDWPDVPPMLARILAGRGVTDPALLDLGLKRLPHPEQFTGLRGAVCPQGKYWTKHREAQFQRARCWIDELVCAWATCGSRLQVVVL